MTNATHPFDALMDITARPEVVFVRGAGSYLWDSNRNRYLDFVQGWAVNPLGHSPVIVADALAAQARRLLTPSPAFYNEQSLKLAKLLVDNSCFDQVFFANSGAEANEGAIKLARKYGTKYKNGAHEIITFEGGFHGRTLATMSASGKKAFEPLFEPKVPGFRKARLNDIESVRKLISSSTVAVMLEPIQGEAGVWPATDEFLKELRALTQQRGLLLIVDEIQTGIGRTGKLFGYQHAGIEPDIMTLGKGIGGGVPLAALLATEHAACFDHGDQGGTFNGNPLMCAAGLVVLDQVGKPDFLKSVVDAGLLLERELQRLSSRHGLGEIRGRGLLLALDLKMPIGAAVVAEAFAAGVLINSPQPDTLRFMPALNVTREEISPVIDCLDTVLTKVGAARRVA
ncbi:MULTISPECIES: acetylornithine transaminase [Bradyrhizobium]|uniref:Acetylornithine aminotransferase n=1 Tax=Bradyrhizobium elkanii TaxID=29448 RepID=A0A8I2C9Q1_BRAEL|nr:MULTISPECIES: acetylornithine transaminase [Bradyrhizobium]MBP1297651.1 acetylornithine/N-succinyldiaminopimelate aminotransferase [Bradyrhizobium elkanii]MCP1931633.1 acetylornithine/N-succinyldiaminopimelate aminotransferase [Bradyrhizobium elkanii]MCS3480217.1 acetylornithine/N-succinyldiaminopimelate aminotransferase [Bradyrhizobium elkanii]MCS3577842.1 acetylornithine/N-succinyldiaminopimelate aminotransferase [Bradyrhizobium elkanii]MCS3720717.1 acetylornithine/N-succinyldiaminopimela